MSDISEGGEYVRDDEGVHEEALGELKGDAGSVRGPHAPYNLVDLKVVVGREERDSGVQRGVV